MTYISHKISPDNFMDAVRASARKTIEHNYNFLDNHSSNSLPQDLDNDPRQTLSLHVINSNKGPHIIYVSKRVWE